MTPYKQPINLNKYSSLSVICRYLRRFAAGRRPTFLHIRALDYDKKFNSDALSNSYPSNHLLFSLSQIIAEQITLSIFKLVFVNVDEILNNLQNKDF